MTRDRSAQVLADALHAADVNCWPDSSECNKAGRYHDPDAKLILAASPTLAAALPMAVEWQRVKAALPEGWHQSIHQPNVPGGQVVWRALAVEWSLIRPMPVTAEGATPDEALSRLADALEGMPR